ncbi:granzyme-like protein 1 [Betta splendens]|uniref:trypsin n=1 Tax=Betta splendens TaxID=158456 RepID=A0A6P7MDW8_BETSP|nr:granzyme-like protein 1 [Betta splendens]
MSVKSELTILLLALILGDQVHTSYIFGGREAVPHSRPYMVYLKGHVQEGKSFTCGAFLLNEDFVMTAAHCQADSYNVLLGVHRVSKPKDVQNISVEHAFPNENYDASDCSNDIMLLKLNSKARFNKNVQPIRLADGGDGSLPKSCAIAGWGRSDKYPNSKSPVLMEVNVTLVENPNCTKHSYCSEGRNGPGQGDSGSPLVCEDGRAFGVMSAGSDPSVVPQIYSYTKISDYKDWINSIYKKAAQLKFRML